MKNEEKQKPFNILKINNLNSMNKNHLIFLIINNNEQKTFNIFKLIMNSWKLLNILQQQIYLKIINNKFM